LIPQGTGGLVDPGAWCLILAGRIGRLP
jgi:hypothetical protein